MGNRHSTCRARLVPLPPHPPKSGRQLDHKLVPVLSEYMARVATPFCGQASIGLGCRFAHGMSHSRLLDMRGGIREILPGGVTMQAIRSARSLPSEEARALYLRLQSHFFDNYPNLAEKALGKVFGKGPYYFLRSGDAVHNRSLYGRRTLAQSDEHRADIFYPNYAQFGRAHFIDSDRAGIVYKLADGPAATRLSDGSSDLVLAEGSTVASMRSPILPLFYRSDRRYGWIPRVGSTVGLVLNGSYRGVGSDHAGGSADVVYFGRVTSAFTRDGRATGAILLRGSAM